MSGPRYAIYLAPPPDTPLWRFGSRVLGRDAATGEDLPGYALPGFPAESWWRLTARPRLYGFHATLKAPFRLAAGETETGLLAAAGAIAASCSPFDLGPLAVTAIGGEGEHGFVALTQTRPCEALDRLERRAVEEADRFRAPLTPEERTARRPERLTERQRAALDRWGYPHVGPDYRFHMTLTDAVTSAGEVAGLLAEAAAEAVGGAPFGVDALVIYRQAGPGEPFGIVARLPFGQAA
jgi:2'-5' RNA ligase